MTSDEATPEPAGAASAPRPFGGRGRLAGALWHLLASVPLGLAWTIVLLYGLVASVIAFPLAVFIGGGLLLLARVGAEAERDRARRLGLTLAPAERPLPPSGFFARARAAGADPATWRDLAYLALLGPTSALGLAVVLGWAAASLAGMTALGWLTSLDVSLGPVPVGNVPAALLATAAGAVAAFRTPYVVRAVVAARSWIARGLLGPDTAELEARAEELARNRDLIRRIALAERRRLERDLHDGAQQRLVQLALELGLARKALDGDPEHARELLADAHEHAKRALEELRELAQGIHPATLREGGLEAAIAQLAGTSPVRIEVGIGFASRPDPDVETAAYFVVAEAITNAVRHAHVERVSVHGTREGDRLVVEVRDDGSGGAVASPGGGLSGLRDRVAAVGGSLTVDSPMGAGTVVRAELPWQGWR